MRLALRLLTSACLLGCASGPAPLPRATSGPAVQGATLTAAEQWDTRRPRSTTLRARSPEVRRIGAQAPSVARRAGSRIDVAFRRAPLDDALRFLADRAGVNLVVRDDVHGEVSLHLRRVHPLDALEALAEAHGARVRWTGSIAVVAAR